MAFKLNVNGKVLEADVDPDTPLLWTLRDTLGITGPKFGCGVGACGACTVHIDGQAKRSCTLPVSAVGSYMIDFLISSLLLVGMILIYGLTPSPAILIIRCPRLGISARAGAPLAFETSRYPRLLPESGSVVFIALNRSAAVAQYDG